MKHFGPMQVMVYADGYTAARETACGLIAGDADSEHGDITKFITFHPLEVTCEHCLNTSIYKVSRDIYDKTGAVEIPNKPDFIPHMRTSVYRRRGAFDHAATVALRTFLDLPTDMPTPEEAASALAREDAKHVGYAERRVSRLRDLLADAERELKGHTSPRRPRLEK